MPINCAGSGKATKPLRILGIDPGYDRIGYALIEASERTAPKLSASGTIRTDRADTFQARLSKIYKEVRKIIRTLKPDGIALEQVFHGKNVKTAILVAHARGVIILAAENLGVSITEYSPRVVKFELQGSASAKKEQVRYMVNQMVPLAQDRKMLDDEYDAIAIALVHAKAMGLNIS